MHQVQTVKRRQVRRPALLTAGALLIATAAMTEGAEQVPRASASGFYNPIVDNYADPWVTQWRGRYYFTATTGSNITIWSGKRLIDVGTSQPTIIWSPSGAEANFQDVWSPELDHFGHHWYIYFAADQNGVNATHRDFVLKSSGNNPMGPYRFVGEIHDRANQWMIDPNVLQYDGKKYFIWSGWLSPKNQVQRLFIAPMRSPTAIDGPGVVISSPTYTWENSVSPIDEGPVSITHKGHTFIVFSANASWTNSYCLGLLTLKGSNPLNPGDWVKRPTPVFATANGVFGPGRASFVTTGNGTQWWMVYNAARYDDGGWDRTIRAQPFTWNTNGTPDFGEPLPLNHRVSWPKGEANARTTYLPQKVSGKFATFSVRVPQSGTYGVYIRYENPNPFTTFQNWAVNGKPLPQLSFPRTEVFPGTRNTYSMADEILTLERGTSKIQIYEGTRLARIQLLQVTRVRER